MHCHFHVLGLKVRLTVGAIHTHPFPFELSLTDLVVTVWRDPPPRAACSSFRVHFIFVVRCPNPIVSCVNSQSGFVVCACSWALPASWCCAVARRCPVGLVKSVPLFFTLVAASVFLVRATITFAAAALSAAAAATNDAG